MFFSLSKAFVALAAVTAAIASTVPSKRQDGLVSCDLLLKPTVHVDSSTTNLFAEFNFVIGRSLAIDANGVIDGGSGSTILAENADNSFLVNDKISAQGETSAETAAIITGWVGETKEGLVANWLVESATCT
ncbi:hypothetical protein GALMADRAFT_1349881 [Galerina marginata CBS 339.88]|uniref:Uncharacterized protein n=1 Tax=Galerina marginata (strain CBS 339.88) TaxID=685588 RepID=A0A067SV72_GALM3|nr:hypothetical protein GALMADRAFT_1349881 [Galerina marginata CBS 339.88]